MLSRLSFSVIAICLCALTASAQVPTATVTGRVTRSFTTRTGVAGGNTVIQVFHMRKAGGSWIIERLGS